MVLAEIALFFKKKKKIGPKAEKVESKKKKSNLVITVCIDHRDCYTVCYRTKQVLRTYPIIDYKNSLLYLTATAQYVNELLNAGYLNQNPIHT